ncbi:MAG: TonB C-terminal domain-containing protein [Bradymonadaceae bacterium]
MVSGIVVSFLLHGGIIAIAVVVSLLPDAPEEAPHPELAIVFDQVDLLALGEEKPPEHLPRIANPEPPAPAPDEAINIARPEEQPTESEKDLDRQRDLEKERELERKRREDQAQREQEERDRRRNEALSSLHNPNRPTNEDVPAGSAQGVAGGTVSDAALANLMGTYQVQLLSELSRYWEVPSTITSGQLAELAGQVQVYVRISESGHIVSYTFRSRSGNEQFNGSIERVLRRFQVQYGGRRLPLPDNPQVRQAVISRGLELKNWESLGR